MKYECTKGHKFETIIPQSTLDSAAGSMRVCWVCIWNLAKEWIGEIKEVE